MSASAVHGREVTWLHSDVKCVCVDECDHSLTIPSVYVLTPSPHPQHSSPSPSLTEAPFSRNEVLGLAGTGDAKGVLVGCIVCSDLSSRRGRGKGRGGELSTFTATHSSRTNPLQTFDDTLSE